MEYRRLGTSGLKISEISLGSWLTYGSAVQMEQSRACVLKAYELGVNHFDCAIAYGNKPHEAEQILGDILRELPRTSYTVTSKAYWKFGPSTYDQGLSRKTLMERVDMSLKATGLDYIDIFYCHRYDTETDLEETLRALDDLVTAGKILYYGVSEWTAAQIENMMAIVDKRNLHKPVVDQPGYNMLWRTAEKEVMPVCAKHGMGVVAFSPLAQGILTGKYKSTQAMPAGTRGADPSKGRWIKEDLTEDAVARVQKLTAVAAKLDLTVGQLALAWVLRRPEMTCALVGATRPEQVEENVKASGVKLPAEIVAEIETILA